MFTLLIKNKNSIRVSNSLNKVGYQIFEMKRKQSVITENYKKQNARMRFKHF